MLLFGIGCQTRAISPPCVDEMVEIPTRAMWKGACPVCVFYVFFRMSTNWENREFLGNLVSLRKSGKFNRTRYRSEKFSSFERQRKTSVVRHPCG